MSGGLVPDEEEKVDEEKSVPPVKKIPKPKTRQQRRKKREREVAERERLAAVSVRRSENEVFRWADGVVCDHSHKTNGHTLRLCRSFHHTEAMMKQTSLLGIFFCKSRLLSCFVVIIRDKAWLVGHRISTRRVLFAYLTTYWFVSQSV